MLLEIARYYQLPELLVFESNVFLHIKIKKYLELFAIFMSLELSAIIFQFQLRTLFALNKFYVSKKAEEILLPAYSSRIFMVLCLGLYFILCLFLCGIKKLV